ncbi:MAG: metal-dependent transcriptional regulator, partial [Candidatus Omnitrophota bacterium]
MNITDRAEEILESLWIEIVEHKRDGCDASVLKDDEVIEELVKADYIKLSGGRIRLSSSGKEEAKNCIRRHRLAERLMVDLLDIKRGLVHETSCKFEHLLHKGIDENVCTLLGHPNTCPHGKPIPEGKCCKDVKRAPKKLIIRLDELDVNVKSKVAYLQIMDNAAIQKIMAIGALPNTDIKVIQKFPSYVLKIGKSQFAVDKELASQV